MVFVEKSVTDRPTARQHPKPARSQLALQVGGQLDGRRPVLVADIKCDRRAHIAERLGNVMSMRLDLDADPFMSGETGEPRL